MENRKWEVFIIDEVFEIKKVKGHQIKTYTSGKYPYITTSSLNNGVTDYVNAPKSDISLGNTLTVNPITGDTFYQEKDFVGRGYSGASVNCLYNNNLNKFSGFFLAQTISQSARDKASYANLFNSKRLSRGKFHAPVNKDSELDWVYMEKLGKDLYQNQSEYLQEYLTQKKKKLEKDLTKKNEEVTEWISFKIDEIFSSTQRGKRLTKANQIGGNIPYISSTSLNNGIDNFIGNTTDVKQSEYNLTIANSGSVGSTFYHDYPYIASDHVHSLTNKKFNKYHYLFISVLLNRLEEKYHFNREINNLRLKNENIILPTNEEGKINLIYMENYMKRIEYNQLSKLIKYLN